MSLFQRRHDDDENAATLKRLLEDLRIRLEETFTFTSEQLTNIRAVARDLIYDPARLHFKSIDVDIVKVLRLEKATMRFSNVFGSPAREAKLVSTVKRIASSVRNAYRQDVRGH
ncbi:hypothetical protein ARMGADRAFT_950904 [Armillaria gallica]|uniref:Uncharacterized protein n=1 Tax=Armillaria gallica TaxID=47427 RepID=A0A2H3CJN8_ARMGA|nr:hypothetical protein ARMGADRAFT_950904 [Armillaria gallica]